VLDDAAYARVGWCERPISRNGPVTGAVTFRSGVRFTRVMSCAIDRSAVRVAAGPLDRNRRGVGAG
jgi:hypothetical protein